MAGGMNLATKYSKIIDERWEAESLMPLISSNHFNFKGDRTVVIYSIPYAPLNDYTRSGTQRYGVPNDLTRNVQTCTVSQDKGFSFIIDRGDEVQAEYVTNPGSSLAREIKQAIVPNYDEYCFGVMARSAMDNGHSASTLITKQNAHEMLLNGIQHMADRSVPVDDVYAFCTYAYGNLLMQDPSFVRYGDAAQRMLKTGHIGRADGVEVVLMPANRLRSGAAILLVHKDAVVAPRQLEEYKTHVDPPGISGTLCEGRVLFDCFVLDEKADGIYFHGGQPILKNLRCVSAASRAGKSTFIMNTSKEDATNKWYVITAEDYASLPVLTYGTAIDVTTSGSPWYGARELRSKETELTIDAGQTVYKIAEVQADMKPIAYAEGKLNVG